MDLLVTFLIYFLVFGLVGMVINYAPFDAKIKQIAYLVLAVFFCIAIIYLLTGGGRVVILR
jgi:hypothetical protein